MTATFPRSLAATFTIGILACGISVAGISCVAGEELRVGFIAPMTGPFAQVGKDMVNGFEMYRDEVKNDFAGASIKFVLEED